MSIKGEDIRKKREELGLTQKELAEMLGLSYKTIQNYESGEIIPQSKNVMLRSFVDGNIINTFTEELLKITRRLSRIIEYNHTRYGLTIIKNNNQDEHDDSWIAMYSQFSRIEPSINKSILISKGKTLADAIIELDKKHSYFESTGNVKNSDVQYNSSDVIEDHKSFHNDPLLRAAVEQNDLRLNDIIVSKDKEISLLRSKIIELQDKLIDKLESNQEKKTFTSSGSSEESSATDADRADVV